MGIATSQQITRYYETYQNIDVVFTKEVTNAIHLVPRQVYIKCLGSDWPCIINSTSFNGAKIIIGSKTGLFSQLAKSNNNVSLRFGFKETEKNDITAFIVSGKVAGMTPYAGSQELMIVSIQYTQRPPDNLVEIIGNLLDANVNASKRKEDRILLSPENLRRLGIAKKETVVFIQGVPRRCILRDISFSGSKVIMVGVANFLKNKDIILRVDFDEPREAIGIKGSIVRTEDVEGRKDLVAVAVSFFEQTIPMSYKLHINDYLTQFSKQQLQTNEKASTQKNQTSSTEKQKASEQIKTVDTPEQKDSGIDKTGTDDNAEQKPVASK